MKTCILIDCHCTDFNRKFCKHYSFPKKAKAKPLSQRPKKSTGELAFFEKEWARRGGKCFITGEPIEFHPKSCFHILGKGAYKHFRLEPMNLIFVKQEFHDDWHILGQEECLKRDKRWKPVIEMYENLRKIYNQTYLKNPKAA